MVLRLNKPWQFPVAIILFTASYFSLAWLIFQIPIQFDDQQVWPLWLPAGFAQSVLLLFGKSLFPGIALGSFFLSTISGIAGLSAYIAAFNNTLQAWIGVTLLERHRFNPNIERLTDVKHLLLYAAILPSCLSATIGVINFCLMGAPWSQFWVMWFDWWIGNVSGTLTLMPMLLTVKQWRTIGQQRHQTEIALWLMLLIGISWFIFCSTLRLTAFPYPLEYFPFPLLIWGALRFSQAGATLATLIVTNLATWSVAQGASPFLANGSTVHAIQSLQAYICVFALTALTLAAIMAERQEAQKQTDTLLLKILPSPIADRLKLGQETIADSFAEVTVLFADIVNFTEMSATTPPQELVALLNEIFSEFDRLAEKHGLEKIKTIGDAYMVVGGLPFPREDHAAAVADMALDMLKEIANFRSHHHQPFTMRIGFHTGPVVAGVIGTKKFIYDLWGDTVNVASRMESHGLPGHIQVTETTYQVLQHEYLFKQRGQVEIKGRGQMITYLLTGRK
jgi:class 3 adenylate cyclase